MTTTKQVWFVYLLRCGNRTYVGSTVDVYRRLRQHNRELVGGARATKSLSPGWKIHMYTSGYPDRSSACRFEALIKRRARGLEARTTAMEQIGRGKCPPGRSRGSIDYTVPDGIKLHRR